MTIAEYLKLVKTSGILDSLDEEIKKKVLNASGDEMVGYAAIIIETIDFMGKAKEEFLKKGKEIMSECSLQIQKVSRKKVKDDEGKSKANDDEESERLLGQLNKI